MSSLPSEGDIVKFLPFSSTVDSPFWVQYCHLKLETIQLSEEAIPIRASFAPLLARWQCQESSLSSNAVLANDRVSCYGSLLGYNTLEAFQTVNKNQLLKDVFCEAFQNENANVESLTKFVLLTFADLKNHKVLFWFGIPTVMTKTPIRATLVPPAEVAASNGWWPLLARKFHALRRTCLKDDSYKGGLPPFFVLSKSNIENDQMHLLNKDILTSTFQDTAVEDLVFGFIDSSSKEGPILGWTLRNLIAYLSYHLKLGGQTISIVSFRPSRLRRLTALDDETADDFQEDTDGSHKSLLLKVTVPPSEEYQWNKIVGWELNARNKPGPRWVNLKPLLDSTHLAIQAADLNLKLMKWRMIPTLNVEMLQKNTKVLLIGAGTLGCSVARTLLGWGIRQFTILDYGTVSYSNPVRQNLFSLEDCHFNNGQGKPKAEAAAEALKTIAADVEATGIHLSIPMPGHASETKESIEESVTTLDRLVRECDVVYLLTDTRESRWLPTVMAAAHDKILINAALGLDSWLVMRHGGGPCGGNRLGCYFCNDVVAPENSTKNRTLDQQCTVTRPGLAPIASSMAVELMVSLLHHPLKQKAAAPKQSSSSYSPTTNHDKDSTSALGIMPHQIRGSLVSYTMMTPTVPAFPYCTACATSTVEAYKADKLDLVYKACRSTDGTYLEDLSGLTAFRAEAADKLADMDDWEDDE